MVLAADEGSNPRTEDPCLPARRSELSIVPEDPEAHPLECHCLKKDRKLSPRAVAAPRGSGAKSRGRPNQ